MDDWNSTHADTFCHLDIKGDCSKPADVVKINIYRIIQESLTNVARHAEAKNVYISLENLQRHGDKLALAINDDGKGFDLGTGPVKAWVYRASRKEWIAWVANFILLPDRE